MQPYFYIIQEKTTGKYYAGSKYGRDADFTNLLTETGYKTSSTIIHQIIAEEGLGAFSINRIRIFNSSKDAYDYETKFLKKVNASKNEKFYNGHNNDILGYGSEGFYDIMENKYGDRYPFNNTKIRKKAQETCLKKWGAKYYFQSDTHKNNISKYGMIGGKVQGRINAENGHMTNIRKMVNEENRKQKLKQKMDEEKTGCFLDKELHKKVAALGGRAQGKINAENGHLTNISKNYWNDVKTGKIKRSKKRWYNNGETERQFNIEEDVPVGYTKGRLKK